MYRKVAVCQVTQVLCALQNQGWYQYDYTQQHHNILTLPRGLKLFVLAISVVLKCKFPLHYVIT